MSWLGEVAPVAGQPFTLLAAMPVIEAVACCPAVPGTAVVTVIAVPNVGVPGVEPAAAGHAVSTSQITFPEVAVEVKSMVISVPVQNAGRTVAPCAYCGLAAANWKAR